MKPIPNYSKQLSQRRMRGSIRKHELRLCRGTHLSGIVPASIEARAYLELLDDISWTCDIIGRALDFTPHVCSMHSAEKTVAIKFTNNRQRSYGRALDG